MTTSNSTSSYQQKPVGDTAVDGLLAGFVGGAAMVLFLVVVGWLTGTPPQTMLAYFDPAQTGSWLTGLLAHLAVSAIYGVVFGLLMGMVGRLRPSLLRWQWLCGAGYGLVLWLLGAGVVLTAVASPLDQIPTWEFAVAHLLYGLVVGYRLQTSH
jgi:hypothetical protein